ncbi:hypothetical protein Z517_05223 [Fonsecaea pedrosoi CBS 271.37]|uniref:Unplaced genomic scaffold supercont1.3, whole genome shotgun sequence n=1 Tax=Fonsecaea pedrosoi CBS 271.37 TaxID=1442368 RepID=A0A0D2DWH9_9EURO|nr:uncharacterized protein Z517_05223 [Fonsecaea pedrosoi CBS 271.37]KIW82196.1 hypothetical protein Z517_05223 [Fonsecaea pedrosoi CBS 271.37]
MALAKLYAACTWLADALEQHRIDDQTLSRTHSAVVSGLRSVNPGAGEEKHNVSALMPPLISHVYEVIQKERPDGFKTAILSTLADATREVPFWRPLFGLEAKPNRDINETQAGGASPPDCIVEVARRVVSETAQTSTSEQTRSALRIIANCCADNNTNRSIIIERGGIEALLEMIRQGRECDLVVPTLYNICVDYDEPARDAAGRPLISLQGKTAKGNEADLNAAANRAEQRLGTYWSPHARLTSFEILLKAKDSEQVSTDTLADLIEMASRIALYETRDFVHNIDGDGPGGTFEVDTTAVIVHALLTHGFELAQEDIDCRASMCQAVLNLLPQPDSRNIIAGDPRLVWNLIHLPLATDGLESETDDANEDEQGLAPYREAILKTTYAVTAVGPYHQMSGCESPLIQTCITTLETGGPRDLLASICVLLTNSVITKERAEKLVKAAPKLPSFLSEWLVKTTASASLLPALNLAVRLALCREGQVAFHQVNMVSAMAVLLASPPSQVDSLGLEIQSDAVVVVRLMIKGRMEYLSDLVSTRADGSRTSIMALIFSLFEETSHARTKTEIGRLSIEILRTLLSSSTSAVTADTDRTSRVREDDNKAESLFQSIFPAQHLPPSPSPTTTTATPDSNSNSPPRTTIADTISWILTQSALSPPPDDPQHSSSPTQNASSLQQTEGEAWFGLALLAAFPSTHGSIRAALARDDFRLLTRLREIASASASATARSSGAESSPLLKEGRNDERAVIAAAVAEEQESASSRGRGPKSRHGWDPRYENIKVLVARIVQSQFQPLSAGTNPPGPKPPSSPEAMEVSAREPKPEPEPDTHVRVRAVLEATATELGLA